MGNAKQAIIDCLSDKTVGLSREEVHALMEEELAKPESEMDCGLIETCTEILMEADGVQEPAFKTAPLLPVERLDANTHMSRRPRWKAVLIAAATAAILMITALVVSAEVFHFDLLHYTVEMVRGRAQITQNGDEVGIKSAEELRTELAEHGFTDVYLPEEYLEGAILKKIHYQETDLSKHVSILFYIGENEVNLGINKFDLNMIIPDSGYYDPNFEEIREVPVDDTFALVLRYDTFSYAKFTDETANVQYTVNTSMDLEETICLMKSMTQ